MKTPDEIKNLLANHKNYTFSAEELYSNALAYIEQLERKLANSEKEVEAVYNVMERVKRERDVAIEDWRGRCFACKHVRAYDDDGYLRMDKCPNSHVAIGSSNKVKCEFWEWHGWIEV